MATFLRDKKVLEADIIAIQEPWRNELNDTTHTNLHPGRTSYSIRKIHYNRGGSPRTLVIHNIYNEPRSGTIEQLAGQLEHLDGASSGTAPEIEHLIVGDMNTHHPAWGGPDTNFDPEGERLLEIADRYHIELTTEEGTVTWERGELTSTIDLTLMSTNLTNRLISWERADDVQHDSDHYPIRTLLNITTPPREIPQRRKWKAMDTKVLHDTLDKTLTVPSLQGASKQRIELAMTVFTATIRKAIKASTPMAAVSEWANPDFTPECREAIRAARYMRRQYTRYKTPRSWVLYKIARNRKKRIVNKALRAGHRRRVQQATEQGPQGLWRRAKWARSRQGAYEAGITPTLVGPSGEIAETVDTKATLFQHAFFPENPPADLSDIPGYNYPSQLTFPHIKLHEIEAAVMAAPADKAPGDDGIPNSLWHKVVKHPKSLEALGEIYNACVEAGFNPAHFQHSITVVLRKGGEGRDYRTPKAYRPVALLNTLGKFLEAIIARRLSYAIETHSLLPPTHLGGRKGISTDHAIQSIIERIKSAWGRGLPVVSMLLLDVVGAYDNAHHERLIHNLRRKRLGHYAPWIQAFLSNRSTRIRMPEGMSERIHISTGIPQGSPLSPILYLIYNADLLLDTANDTDGTTTSGWVDDVAFLTTGASEEANVAKLQRASAQADRWAKHHASVFDTKKYKLIHFINPRSATEPKWTTLHLPNGTTIEPTRDAERFLGIWLDPGLTFEQHRSKAVAKAGTSLEALRGISGSTWGVALSAMRRIYQAIVIPQMLYGVAAWFQPGTLTKKQTAEVTRGFASIQKRAACLISGAFRTTAGEALNVELHLLPIRLQMEQLAKETALRIRTGPAHAVPQTIIWPRSDEEVKLSGYTPLEVQAWKMGGCLQAPPDTVAGEWESRQAYIRAPWQTPPRVVLFDTREEAITAHNKQQNTKTPPLALYSDGSGYQGYIGSAVVAPEAKRQYSACLGTEGTSTVYAAEACGIEFGLRTAVWLRDTSENEHWEERTQQGVVIYTDSQSALRTFNNPGMVSGQVFVRTCQGLLEQCAELDIPITLQWIPGHENVTGNEAADRAAKRAAQRESTTDRAATSNHTGTRYWLASAAKRRIRQSTKDTWKRGWEKGKTGAPTRRLFEAPTKKALRYWGGLRKATASILIQLRTGRVGLNHYLFKINRRDSPRCPCGFGYQTPRHIVLVCPQYTQQRQKLWERIDRQIRLSTRSECDALLGNKEAAAAVTQYMVDTGVLDQFRAVDPEALGEETTHEDAEGAQTEAPIQGR